MAKLSELLIRKDNLYLVKTTKYKSVNIYLRFAFEYDELFKAKLMVLANMLGEISEKYPTKESMMKAKDMLYSFSINTNQNNIGNLITLTINYDYINPHFLNDVKEEDFIELIDETLYHQLFTEDFFKETLRNTKANIKRDFDVPSNLATDNFIKEVGKDVKAFNVYSNDVIDELDSLKLSEVIETYNQLFNTRVDIFVIGDYSDKLVDYLSNIKSKKDLFIECRAYPFTLRDEIDYSLNVSQSTLIVSYSAPYVKTSDEFIAFNLANIMFGGIPSSLLFSEVREKYSLCYSIFARAFRYEGLVIVKTDIDGKNKDKVLEEINKQFIRMQNLDFDPELLDIAKLMLINSSLSIDDDLDYFCDYYYANALCGLNTSVNEYIEKVNEVTLSDISKVFSNYKNYLTYFLEGTKHE